MPALDQVKALLAALPREDQEDLTRFLHDILFDPTTDAPLVASLRANAPGGGARTYTYRVEYVKCGKEACRCREGKGHGPYAYKYWREGDRVRKKYVGRQRPR